MPGMGAHRCAPALHAPADPRPFHPSLSSLALSGFALEEQRLVFCGKQLEDEQLLSLVGVEEEATLHVLGRLLGGGKKRKKKVCVCACLLQPG